MNRYEVMFENLSKLKQKAFVPFVTLGDPDLETSFDIVKTLIKAGADALELGIPFSDPLADGPTIQKGNKRALEKKIYTKEALGLVKKIRKLDQKIPIGILSYANLAYGLGVNKFFKELSLSGVDSLLLADVPVEMASFLRDSFLKYKISQVLVAPPNASNECLQKISKYSQGYIYLLGRSGVTGHEISSEEDISPIIKQLKKMEKSSPLLQGFGISTKKHVRDALKKGVDGIFVGSAFVKIIENNANCRSILCEKIYIKALEIKNATILAPLNKHDI